MLRRRRALAVAGLAALVVTGAAVSPSSARSECAGVILAVDFSTLGGARIPGAPSGDEPVPGAVACVEVDGEDTAFELLARAGLDVEGTAQWGDAFVCRVVGRPASDEDVVLPDGGVVREGCVRTPSTAAYWSVWSADASSEEWAYAPVGVTEVVVGPGDAVGLAFTVGQAHAVPPGISVAAASQRTTPAGWADLSVTDVPASADAPAGSQGPGIVPLVAVALVVLLGGVALVRGLRR